MFLDELQFRKRQWEIICPEMSLTYRGAAGNPRTWAGSGFVRTTDAGELEFRLITRDPYDFVASHKLMAHGETGTLVKDDDFFDLAVKEVAGCSWSATRVRAESHGGDHGMVWEGKLSEIRHADEVRFSCPASLSLAFYGNFDVPCNEVSITHRKVGQRLREESFDRNAACHQIGGYEVWAICEDDRLLLELQSDSGPGVMPQQLTSRIEETLEFLFGQPMRAAITDTIDDNGSVTCLRGSFPVHQGPFASPPVQIQRVGGSASFWHRRPGAAVAADAGGHLAGGAGRLGRPGAAADRRRAVRAHPARGPGRRQARMAVGGARRDRARADRCRLRARERRLGVPGRRRRSRGGRSAARWRCGPAGRQRRSPADTGDRLPRGVRQELRLPAGRDRASPTLPAAAGPTWRGACEPGPARMSSSCGCEPGTAGTLPGAAAAWPRWW